MCHHFPTKISAVSIQENTHDGLRIQFTILGPKVRHSKRVFWTTPSLLDLGPNAHSFREQYFLESRPTKVDKKVMSH